MCSAPEANPGDSTLSLRVPFGSAWELSCLFASLGLDFRIVQITRGELSGFFELCGNKDMPVFSIRTNQGLLFEGTRHQASTPIALEHTTSLEMHRVRGEAVGQNCVHGFSRHVRESFFQLSPGAHTTVALLNSQRLGDLVEATGEDHLFERMESANSIELSSPLFKRMQELLLNTTTTPALHQELMHAAVLECLQPDPGTVLQKAELSQSAGLMKELLTWGNANPTRVIKLEDLTRSIFASRSAIVQNCRSTFGIGPMALLKQIRLGQVQHALSQAQVQRKIGCSNVQTIASYYGFTSRNHFARDYRQHFGEAPNHTLQQSSDPGIGAQSVSVAQSPQIAIARK